MFAVIFEVEPRRERWEDYLALAGSLRAELENIDGFIANERFASRRRSGRVLSLSIWRDEKALVRWRIVANHHLAQARGRSEIFADYHLRVGEIIADNRLPPGQALFEHRFDVTEIGTGKFATITELASQGVVESDFAAEFDLSQLPAAGIVEHETFTGINDSQKQLLLVSWADPLQARSWQPALSPPSLRHRAVRIVRDYGMRDRREAPQYFPPVDPPQPR